MATEAKYEWTSESKKFFYDKRNPKTGKMEKKMAFRTTVFLTVTGYKPSGEPVTTVYKGYRHRGMVRVMIPGDGIYNKDKSMCIHDFELWTKENMRAKGAEVVNTFREMLAGKVEEKQAA